MTAKSTGTSSGIVYVFGRSIFQPSHGGVAIAVGDLNGDGRPDFIASNPFLKTISIMLAQPSGGFSEAGAVTLQEGANSGAIADFNGDGKADIALLTSSGVLIFLGNGDGTFAAPSSVSLTGFKIKIIAGDFNHDGKPDLALAAASASPTFNSPGTVTVLLGNGDGTFGAPISTAAGIGVQDFAAADFNKDGNLDVVVVDGPPFIGNTISLLLGNGDGTFQAATNLTGATGPTGVAIADFNGDGNPDLAISTTAFDASGNGLVSVLIGNGDGTFQPRTDAAVGGFANGIVVADLNQDGNPDIIVNSGLPFDGSISVILGKGDGTFQPHTDYKNGQDFGTLFAGDFNGDGKTDIGLANLTIGFEVFLGHGDGTIAGSTDFTTGTGPTFISAGDLNGDGIPDAVVVNSPFVGCPSPNSSASVYLSKGDGTFAAAANYPTGNSPQGVATGDFTGKGRLDIAVVNICDNTVSVLLNMGNGTYQAKTDYPTGIGPDAIAIGDFNSDGILDLAVANSIDNTVSILLGNGDGTFQPKVNFAVGSTPTSIVAVDLKGDGKLDLVTTDNCSTPNPTDSGRISVLLGNGDGTFQSFNDVDLLAAATPVSVVSGDFNGDGKPDLAVVANESLAGTMITLFGNGDGTFGTPSVPLFVGQKSNQAVAADFDGDGILDIAITSMISNQMTLFKGVGNGTFVIKGTYGGTSMPQGIVAADFNGDNFLDAAFVNLDASTFTEYLNTPGPGPDFTITAAPPSASVKSATPATVTYMVSVGARNGFNQSVSLACTGAPKNSTCTVSPSSVTPSGNAKQIVTVSVSLASSPAAVGAQSRSIAPFSYSPWFGVSWLAALAIGFALAWKMLRRASPRLAQAAFAIALLCATSVVFTACGGGSQMSNPPPPPPPPPPPLVIPTGTYTLTITGTSGTSQHTVNLTLFSRK
jgi:hypothetical protein